MSRQHIYSALRFFCALLTIVYSLQVSNSLFAQVPANVHSSGIPGAAESAFPIASKVVKVMATESAIPFGAESISGNLTLLQMKGNDQEFTRKFTFKNTSTVPYTINSIDLDNKDSRFEFMSVESGESLPLDVPPGHSFTIRIAFHAIELNALCSDKLNFNTEQSGTPISYSIQGKQEAWQRVNISKATASAQSN